MELKAYISYHQKRKEIGFWRSTDKYEVDFIIGDEIAIEIKSTKKVSDKHLKGLKVLQEEQIVKKFYLISEDPISKLTQGIEFLHWKNFLQQLWNDKIF